MNISRLVLGFFAIGIAATFYITAMGYPAKAANMPLIYSVVVALLGAAMVGQEVFSIRQRRKMSADGAATSTNDASPEEETISGQAKHRKPWKAMLAFLLAAVYLYSISIMGYLIATVGFMVVALAMIGHVLVALRSNRNRAAGRSGMCGFHRFSGPASPPSAAAVFLITTI